jgi:hypothetical protein
MLMARAATVLLYATAATVLNGCAGPRLDTETPAGASFAGNWKLNPAASDDPQKILAHLRTEAIKIINRNAAAAQARGAASATDAATDDPGAHGPRRDPLQHSPMAHIVQQIAARGDTLSVRQSAGEIVFDYGTSHRSFTPGAHSVVSAEGGVGDQSSGWKGREYLIVVKAQQGPEVTETYALSGDGQQLVDKIHIGSYELPAVDLNRIYIPSTASAPRQLPTTD